MNKKMQRFRALGLHPHTQTQPPLADLWLRASGNYTDFNVFDRK